MMFLREVFSVVLLFAPAEAETGQPPDSDVNSLASNCGQSEYAGPGVQPGDVLNADGYTLTFFVPSECTRRMPRPETWVRAPIPDLQQTGETDQDPGVIPFIKDVLRMITAHLGVETRAHSEAQTTQTTIILISTMGIRG